MKKKQTLSLLPLLALPLPLLAAGSLDQCTYFIKNRDFTHAIAAAHQALQETDPRNHSQISAAHLCLGAALKQSGSSPQAMEELSKVRDLGADPADVLVATTLMAAIYLAGGEQTTALQYYHEAARLAREQKNRVMEAAMLRNIGSLFYDRKDAEHALHYFEQSANLGGDTDAAMLNAMAALYTQKKMLQQAISSEMKALELAKKHNEPIWASRYKLSLGELYRQTRQFDQAAPLLDQARQEAHTANDRQTEAAAFEAQGQLARDRDQPEEASRFFQQAKEVFASIGDKYNTYRMYLQVQLLKPEKTKKKSS